MIGDGLGLFKFRSFVGVSNCGTRCPCALVAAWEFIVIIYPLYLQVSVKRRQLVAVGVCLPGRVA